MKSLPSEAKRQELVHLGRMVQQLGESMKALPTRENTAPEADEVFRYHELDVAIQHLSWVANKLEYLKSPIEACGTLHVEDEERCRIEDFTVTCGDTLEILQDEEWVKGVLHYDEESLQYRISGACEAIILEGAMARIRKAGYSHEVIVPDREYGT